MEARAVWPVLELRRAGNRLTGAFPYRSTATIRDRGRVRKERFEPGAFRFAVEDPDREIHLLSGHSYDRPLASRSRGSLELEDRADALTFAAELPDEAARPTWMRDTVLALEAGLIGGVSPGFAVPPASAVPDAEGLEAEAGNPGVQVRVIRAAVLFELSLVTRPAYGETEVDLRAFAAPARRRPRLWL